MKLQVALDFMNQNKILNLTSTLKNKADIIEIGTPALTKFGISIVDSVKKHLSFIQIVCGL